MLNSTIASHGSYSARVLKIEINKKQMVTPTYFPSISRASTRLRLEPLIETSIDSGYPRLLVSAYDLYKLSDEKLKRINRKLTKFISSNNFLFIDSGTFESYWLRDPKWSFPKYKKIMKKCYGDIFAGYDEVPALTEKAPEIYRKVSKYTNDSWKFTSTNHCITICHGNGPKQICQVVKNLCKDKPDFCNMIAIAERDCGKTIEERISIIREVRSLLNQNNEKNVLHILGCGNLLSIALFTLAGADTFDSVDWSRWLIDRTDLKFTDKTHQSLIECNCSACVNSYYEPTLKVLYHNLIFYQEFLKDLRESIIKKNELSFLENFVDRKTISKIVKYF